MPNSTSEFMKVIADWGDTTKASTMAAVIDAIQELNNLIIETTPVDTGFLRGSYFAAIDDTPQGEGSIGRDSSSAVNAVAAELKRGQTYIMGNTAAYARRVEFGFVGVDSLGRYYNQHGRFWMTAAIAQMPGIMADAAEAAKNGQQSDEP